MPVMPVKALMSNSDIDEMSKQCVASVKISVDKVLYITLLNLPRTVCITLFTRDAFIHWSHWMNGNRFTFTGSFPLHITSSSSFGEESMFSLWVHQVRFLTNCARIIITTEEGVCYICSRIVIEILYCMCMYVWIGMQRLVCRAAGRWTTGQGVYENGLCLHAVASSHPLILI